MKKFIFMLVLAAFIISQPAFTQGKGRFHRSAKKKKVERVEYGTASYYHNKFDGRRAANGEIFRQSKLTAAHNNVPFGTWLKVTNLRNHKTVIVKVIDRLHYKNRRLVDLSKAAANKIDFSSEGLLRVKVEVLGKKKPRLKNT